jgi:pimeloyl-ACP methyl ester carboxylesterase
MPYINNEEADIFWTTTGSGPPVLLIMGLSLTHEMWYRVLPGLQGYRCILFDNRGMGRSSVPARRYSIAQMARDARAVLTAAGERSATVIGASMGGMIAQELALQFPEIPARMILACTSHSGVFGRWPNWSFMPWPGRWSKLERTERERRFVRLLHSDSTPRERIQEDIRIRSACMWSPIGFRNQLAAILLWSAYRRLPRLRVPTLVIHGREDRLIPAVNGVALSRRIPGSTLKLIDNAGHIMTTDQPEACHAAMREFLDGSR